MSDSESVKAAAYRLHAAHCAEIAQGTSDREGRATLLMMSSCHPTRRGLNYIAANSITLSRGAADAGACGFFLSAMRAVVRFSAPRFVRQLIYFT